MQRLDLPPQLAVAPGIKTPANASLTSRARRPRPESQQKFFLERRWQIAPCWKRLQQRVQSQQVLPEFHPVQRIAQRLESAGLGPGPKHATPSRLVLH